MAPERICYIESANQNSFNTIFLKYIKSARKRNWEWTDFPTLLLAVKWNKPETKYFQICISELYFIIKGSSLYFYSSNFIKVL